VAAGEALDRCSGALTQLDRPHILVGAASTARLPSRSLMKPSPHDVTQMLRAWSDGDQEVLDRLVPLVYDELRRQAARYLRHERPGQTLQTTDLIHEAYLRLVNQKDVQWQNRAHFYGIAAQLMRRILVDHARKRRAAKRGGPAVTMALEEGMAVSREQDVDVIALDKALDRLAVLDPQQGRVVELRYFSGLSIEETAEVLGVSPRTVKRDWQVAKAWLRHELSPSGDQRDS
jgi:RNA polymerase sigma factor (TIGR02999 family)